MDGVAQMLVAALLAHSVYQYPLSAAMLELAMYAMFEEVVAPVSVNPPTSAEFVQAAGLFVPSVGPQNAQTSKNMLLPVSVPFSVACVACTAVAVVLEMPKAVPADGIIPLIHLLYR